MLDNLILNDTIIEFNEQHNMKWYNDLNEMIFLRIELTKTIFWR